MTILVTGGLGYIGSHTVVELLNNNFDVVIIDNLSNTEEKILNGIKEITGKNPIFYPIDLKKRELISKVLDTHHIDGCIHFAAFKAVGESQIKPIDYYENNLFSLINLLQEFKERNISNFIFSSSCTVYGQADKMPIDEYTPIKPAESSYGKTKQMCEDILKDFANAHQKKVSILRYFNPIGAHESGLIGEDPKGIPNNLVPYIAQVAVGKLPKLGIFGDDYDTADGTCLRDYIHVVDLARGHVLALKKFEEEPAVRIYNLGTGNGISVLEVFHAFEKACGKKLAYEMKPRRDGDVPVCYADSSKAEKELGFKAEFGIERMCADSWRWQSMNPDGYRG